MGKKRNKKAIIITALLMVTGILLTLAGIYGNRFFGLFSKGFDYEDIKPEDLGKNVETDIQVYYEDIDIPDKTLQLLGDFSSDDFKYILLDLSALSEEDKSLYYKMRLQHITIRGRLRAVGDAEFEETVESFISLYEDYITEHIYDPEKDLTEAERADLMEASHQMLRDQVTPYCIEVRSVSSFNWFPFIPAGAVLFLVSLIVEICFVFKLKKRIVLPVVFGLMIIVPGILFFNKIRTVLTIKKVSDGVYTMKNLDCTDTQGMLDSGASSVNGLMEWIFDRHFYGIPNMLGVEFDFGCSAFAASTPEGDHLFGRNFDFPETDALLIYSNPEGAYKSIGIADLGVLSVGDTYPIDPDSSLGKLIMTITPYMVVDGMNEKGVGAGILQLAVDETHQDNGKPDLLVFCAIRAILDRCASVDEALVLLDSYDIHSDMETDYHLFITDRSGKYVVVEWLDGQMVVTEYPSCTNSIIAPGKYHDMGEPDDRIGTITECLGSGRVVTGQEAMAVLEKVRNRDDMTEWSCVYNLDDFTVDICFDAGYENVYSFGWE